MVLRWNIKNNTVTFNVEFNATEGIGWFGVGLSETGSMKGADIWTLIQGSDGKWALTDRHADGFIMPTPDASQDVTLLRVTEAPGPGRSRHVSVAFSRALAPCDARDLAVQPGMQLYLLWAFGRRWGYHGSVNRGNKPVVLLPAPSVLPAAPAPGVRENTSSLRLVLPKTPVPEKETTYVYRLFELPQDRKYHAVSYSIVFSSPIIHHAVAYTCVPSAPVARLRALAKQPLMYDGPDGPAAEARSLCMQFWLLGAPHMEPSHLPPQAGLPFGPSPSPGFVLMEVHLNNPNLTKGLVDPGSGLQVNYTSQLRPNDAGILTLSQFSLDIPPGLPSFSAPPAACPAACSRHFKQPRSLLLQAVHMHGLGKSAITRRFRNGSEVAPLVKVAAFDYNFQNWEPVPPSSATLLPGERLELTCTFDSTSRTKTTRMGPGTQDEMCFHWIMYLPADPNMGYCTTLHGTAYAACSPDDTPFIALQSRNSSLITSLVKQGKLVTDDGANATYAPYRPAACAAAPSATAAEAGGPRAQG